MRRGKLTKRQELHHLRQHGPLTQPPITVKFCGEDGYCAISGTISQQSIRQQLAHLKLAKSNTEQNWFLQNPSWPKTLHL